MAKNKRRNKKVEKRKGNNNLIIVLVSLIILSGIVYAVGNGSKEDSPKNKIKLPSYAYTNPITLKAYTYATESPEMLEQIPCYCGCGGMGHRFLRDCFINDDLTYEEHASFCDICVGLNIKVQGYLADEMTLKEARAEIESEYSKYISGKTNTPPVSDYYKPILSGKTEEST